MKGRLTLLCVLLAGFCAGCVERIFLVRTPGFQARVYFDGELAGVTGVDGDSVAIPFHSYGKHEVLLRAEGCKPRRDVVQLEVPWFATFPLDLFTEVLLPIPFRDVQERTYMLARLPDASPHEDLFRRADALRQRLEGYTPRDEHGD